MGESYQTLLVVAPVQAVVEQLTAMNVSSVVLPAGPGHTAVLPEEDDGYADVDAVAAALTRLVPWPALVNVLVDSDVLVLVAYRDGHVTHTYVSDQSMLVDWFPGENGEDRFRINGVEQPAGATPPSGTVGADPAALRPYANGDVDENRLAALLRDDDEDDLRAGPRHRAILNALGLDPRSLTTAYRGGAERLPGAVLVPDPTAPTTAAGTRDD